jgi:hypothetical protein
MKLKQELILAAALIGFGLLLLPAAVYWVGREVVGEYAAPDGLWGLTWQIWSDFLVLDPGAWVLVLSPYLIVQCLRVTRRAWRPGPSVTDFTKWK